MANQTIAKMFQSGNLKDIPGYEGLYAVSRSGRVWSYPKKGNKDCAKWLKASLYKNVKGRIKPYYTYRIMLVKDGARETLRVSRLVALTYIPNPENKPDVNHINGNTLINEDWNLEWSTKPENMEHAQQTGLLNQFTEKQIKTRSDNGKLTGAINGMKARRKFSMSEANCIRQIYEVGQKSYRAIARVYRCSDKTISNICRGKTYLIEIA